VSLKAFAMERPAGGVWPAGFLPLTAELAVRPHIVPVFLGAPRTLLDTADEEARERGWERRPD
jgi:hypothetical protein